MSVASNSVELNAVESESKTFFSNNPPKETWLKSRGRSILNWNALLADRESPAVKDWLAIADNEITVGDIPDAYSDGTNVTLTNQKLAELMTAAHKLAPDKRSTPGFVPGKLIDDTPSATGKNVRDDNVEYISLLVLDFEIKDGKVPDIEAIKRQLAGYAHVLKSSFSHDPVNGNPRYRIGLIIDARVPVRTPEEREAYAAVYRDLFGGQHDPSCANPGRYYHDGYRKCLPHKPVKTPRTADGGVDWIARQAAVKAARRATVQEASARPPHTEFNVGKAYSLKALVDAKLLEQASATKSERPKTKSDDPFAAFSEFCEKHSAKDDGPIKYQGFNLKAWAFAYKKTFDIEGLLTDRGLAFDKARQAGGVYVKCARERVHTSDNPPRTYCVNGTDGHGFVIHCSGSTVENESDPPCVKLCTLGLLRNYLEAGLIALDDLRNPEYGGGLTEREKEAASAKAAESEQDQRQRRVLRSVEALGIYVREAERRPAPTGPEKLKRRLANVTPAIRAILKAAVVAGDVGFQDDVVMALMTALQTTGARRGKTVLNDMLKEARGAHRKAKKKERRTEESHRELSPGVIDLSWPAKMQLDLASGILAREASLIDPELFTRPEGGHVRCVHRSGGRQMEDLNGDAAAFAFEMNKRITCRFVDKDGDAKYPFIPTNLMQVLRGAPDVGLPVFNRIVYAPVFNADGSLIEKAGYHKDLGIIHEPTFDMLPVPGVGEIADDDVDEAVGWLGQVILDFPFSDMFDGSENLPIYTDELDDDGWRIPNWDRGRSSRANTLAFIIQPFVQDLIDGAFPCYHIDKPAAGTGASILTNIISIIATGRRSLPQTIPDDHDELRKQLGATLRQGSGLLFFDNFNGKLDSGPLASLITEGCAYARLLGKSEMVAVELNMPMTINGNMAGMSHEMFRRMVPIRLDACDPKPEDRAKFKYDALAWCAENRPKLVWAVHVIVRNWLQKGKPKGSGMVMGGFENYCKDMSGILEAAGVNGFLENVIAYRADRNDDSASDNALIEACAKNHKLDNPMKVQEMFDAYRRETEGFSGLLPGQGEIQEFGKRVGKLTTRTFDIYFDNTVRRVKLVMTRDRNPRKYKIVALPGSPA